MANDIGIFAGAAATAIAGATGIWARFKFVSKSDLRDHQSQCVKTIETKIDGAVSDISELKDDMKTTQQFIVDTSKVFGKVEEFMNGAKREN